MGVRLVEHSAVSKHRAAAYLVCDFSRTTMFVIAIRYLHVAGFRIATSPSSPIDPNLRSKLVAEQTIPKTVTKLACS